MKRGRFSEEQIVGILREAEREEKPVGEICREHGIAEQTFYRWRKRFGKLEVSDVQRLRELAAENVRLKRLLAERDLDVDALKELLSKKW
jgi:putative transposase